MRGGSLERFSLATVLITLPDQLALEAEQAGLLSPEMLEGWLREQLRRQSIDKLFSAMERMAFVDDPPFMPAAEIAQEMEMMRREQRRSPLP